jgi:hypothetical protein
VGDQAVYSLGNLGIGILVLRAGTAAQFGDFSLSFLTINLLVVACRGFTGEYLLQSPAGGGQARAALRRSILAAGVVVLFCAALIPFVSSGVRSLVVVTCLVAPVVLVEDYATRYILIWARRSDLAALSDTVWLGAQFGVWALLPRTLNPETRGMAAWGIAAFVSAIPVALAVFRILHRDGSGRGRIDRKRALHMSGDNLVAASPAPLSTAIVTLVASISVAGILRGGQLAFNSLTVAMYGFRSVALRESRANEGEFPRLFVVMLVAITAAWTLVLLVIPEHFAHIVFGSQWPAIRRIVPPIAVGRVVQAVLMGITVSARSKAQTKKVLFARIATTVLILVGIGAGAHFGGALLASWMDAAAQLVLLPLWYYIFRVARSSPLALGDA